MNLDDKILSIFIQNMLCSVLVEMLLHIKKNNVAYKVFFLINQRGYYSLQESNLWKFQVSPKTTSYYS